MDVDKIEIRLPLVQLQMSMSEAERMADVFRMMLNKEDILPDQVWWVGEWLSALEGIDD